LKTNPNTSHPEAIQNKGAFVGPKVPTIVFMYGERILGEVRYLCYGDKSNWVYQSLTKLAQQLRMLGNYGDLKRLYSMKHTFKIYY